MEKDEPKISGAAATRRVLLVLFIPSADRAGKTLPNQDEWKRNAMEFFGTTYGGATAMPRAEGIWRDDENGGALVPDFPILLHCYMTEEHASDKKLQAKVGAFCKKMGKEMKQGEVAVIIDGMFYSFSHFG
ncbi:MAG: hypothetical protein ABSH20_11620 [Tepidisphaeraceae bacterium]|jgi:hypothetical protein